MDSKSMGQVTEKAADNVMCKFDDAEEYIQEIGERIFQITRWLSQQETPESHIAKFALDDASMELTEIQYIFFELRDIFKKQGDPEITP